MPAFREDGGRAGAIALSGEQKMSVVASHRETYRRRTTEPARGARMVRLPIVGLFGGATRLAPERAALAHEVGTLVALMGAHLLTASSNAVNEAAADGFASVAGRGGLCIGNVPRGLDGACDKASSTDAAPIRNVELAIFTTVPGVKEAADDTRLQRLNFLTVNVILVLPGNDRMPSELRLPAKRNGAAGDSPAQGRTILVGPSEEFSPELRSLFLQVPTAAAAEAPLCRMLEDHRFVLETGPLT